MSKYGGIFSDGDIHIPYHGTPDYLDPNPITITFIVDRRFVYHDGYCSEPGEDVGEWEHNMEENYLLNSGQLAYLTHNNLLYDNKLDSTFLKSLDSDKLGCRCGSNYCGYEGQARVKSGFLPTCPVCQEYLSKKNKCSCWL